MFYTVADIVYATGCPRANVAVTWAALVHALEDRGVDTRLVEVGTIATVATETPGFKPLSEFGTHPEYDTGRLAARLGNTPEADGDGQLYEGRGLIQLTGRANYAAFGQRLGIDLINNPDLALRPDIAAKLFAEYFVRRGVVAACEHRDWRAVRRYVNGGYTGWDRFADVIRKLGEAVQ